MSDRDAARRKFLEAAAKAFEKLVPENAGWDETFDQIESQAEHTVAALGRDLLKARLAATPDLPANTTPITCPNCQHKFVAELPAKPKRAARTLSTTLGDVSDQRQRIACPSCRHAFSPSGHGDGA